MAKRQFWLEVIRRRVMVRGKAANSSASCVWTFLCLLPVLLMNLSMSTTWASYELFNVYYLGFLWTCQCLQPVLLMNLSMPTHTVLLMNLSTCQRWQGHQSQSAIPWFSKGMFDSDVVVLLSCLFAIYRDFSPQHRTKSCLQICTCWKLERGSWAALVWWTLFRDSCLEVFLANTETEMLMMLRVEIET